MGTSIDSLIRTLQNEGIQDAVVLDAFRKVPRESFVRPEDIEYAYDNRALPIDCKQTISQPYIIAMMTQLLIAHNPKRVLEIGTGSGYQACILAHCVPQVYTIERIKPLYIEAQSKFKGLKLDNIHPYYGDGFEGLPDEAPFDAILLTAAPPEVPPKLLLQLSKRGGRMVTPVGTRLRQHLMVIDRKDDHYSTEMVESVMFVPLLPGTD